MLDTGSLEIVKLLGGEHRNRVLMLYFKDVIGRESELNEIVDKLIVDCCGCEDSVGFVTVVGVGGLGKTTLAQLVFNDERVKSVFPLRLWACVADQNGQEFDVKSILGKILESASHQRTDCGFAMDVVQSKVREVLGGKKYLLVLDDVWNEDREKWLDLRNFLMVSAEGSRILVTSRSKKTAQVVGNDSVYELDGLSPEHSWRLFEMTAFGSNVEHLHSHNLVKIGSEIVNQCANVPLAIKVVGSLLFGQDESRWQCFRDNGLAKINKGDNKIMSMLKLSYLNLESPLRSCFAYCSLFPKDFSINKKIVIRLWAAQGYIMPFEEGQSIEDTGEEYFLTLLRRCFFQDVTMNEYGEVISFKLHDLMHDVAKMIAGNEISVMNSIPSYLGDNIRHIFHTGSKGEEITFAKKKIRSYVSDGPVSNLPLGLLVANWTFLRSLDLHDQNVKTLPSSIGKLIYLRYLDLSWNINLEVLPNSITKIHNLQTLDLSFCSGLRELPADLSKLVKLRHLDITRCRWLSHMPSGMSTMMNLTTLTEFVVGEKPSGGVQCIGQLDDLLSLTNLRGNIVIRIRGNCADNTLVVDREEERGRLRRMKRIKDVSIVFPFPHNGLVFDHEPILEKLEPPPNTRALELWLYAGNTLPSRWGTEGYWETFLPNLVKIHIRFCEKLQLLPSLRKLQHLKSLVLHNLTNLDYMEDTNIINVDNGVTSHSKSRVEEITFFPSLKYLEISGLDKLKGWWKGTGPDGNHNCNWQPPFPCLSELTIKFCPNLVSFPSCPGMKTLLLDDLTENLRMTLGSVVEIHDLGYLKSLPIQYLTSLSITENEMEDLSRLDDAFKSCYSLKSLTFYSCRHLKSLSVGGWQHLTVLQSLKLSHIPELALSDDNDDDVPWKHLHRSLHSLELISLPKLVTLPKGLRCLTSLQSLLIQQCENLEIIPEWIGCMSTLESLCISSCNNLVAFPKAVRNITVSPGT